MLSKHTRAADNFFGCPWKNKQWFALQESLLLFQLSNLQLFFRNTFSEPLDFMLPWVRSMGISNFH